MVESRRGVKPDQRYTLDDRARPVPPVAPKRSYPYQYHDCGDTQCRTDPMGDRVGDLLSKRVWTPVR
jgi:hypothetical protein